MLNNGESVTCTIINTFITGQILPTGTTCEDFRDAQIIGTLLPPLPGVNYRLKDSTINSVNPGVFFYLSAVPGPFTSLEVTETDLLSWPVIGVQMLDQIVLWDSACTKVHNTETTFEDGIATIVPLGPITSDTYYIQIKYTPSTLVGFDGTGGNTNTYSFQTSINGDLYSSGDASVYVMEG